MGSTNDQQVRMLLNPASMGASMANAIPHIDQVVWTCARSPPPPQLAGVVPEDLFASTFDAVKKLTAESNEQGRAMTQNMTQNMFGGGSGGIPFIPCCVPCLIYRAFSSNGAFGANSGMSEMMAQAQKMEQTWLALAQAEQEKYQPYNVHVTLATETRMSHSMHGHGSHTHTVVVGLRFDVAAVAVDVVAAVAPVMVAVAAPMPQAMEGGAAGGGLANELEKLANLKASGMLTEAEYSDAKAKLLSSR